jgi:glutamyl-tRNA reductase
VTPGDEPSSAAERARESLREEINSFRSSIDQMLAHQASSGHASADRVHLAEERLLRLEGRVDQIEQERRFAEWRMYSNVERLLDDLLRELRSIADRLSR